MAAQLCLGGPVLVTGLLAAPAAAGHCRLAVRRASVHGVEGSDALLAARLAAGDDRALADVFDQLASSVYGGALRVVANGSAAQDVVQDVFVELWSHPDRYDPAAGSLRTYLIVLARHRAVDLMRSELRRVARQERHYRLTPDLHITGDSGRAADVLAVVPTLALD
jgi:DNA-directed RNA polymerase specialized sigma24 family protein